MGNRGVFFLILLLALVITPTLSAATSFYVPKGENYSISFNSSILIESISKPRLQTASSINGKNSQ